MVDLFPPQWEDLNLKSSQSHKRAEKEKFSHVKIDTATPETRNILVLLSEPPGKPSGGPGVLNSEPQKNAITLHSHIHVIDVC